MAGSPGYQSPEQLRAETTGVASDVYAYGAVMHVTIAETALWPGLSYFQIMQKVTSNVKPNTTVLPKDFKALCDQCYSSVSERPPLLQVLSRLQELL